MESGMRRTTRSQSRIQQQSPAPGVGVEVGAVKKVVDSAKKQPRRALADVTNSSECSPFAAPSPMPVEGSVQWKPVEERVQPRCELNSFDPVIQSPVYEAEDVTDDDERSSNWSVAVNVSSPVRRRHEDSEASEDEETDEEAEYDDEEEEDEEAEVEKVPLKAEDDFESELCKSMKNVTLEQPATGRHFRFKYKSDDEREFEIEEVRNPTPPPPAVKLTGLPTPTGKHLRFKQEEDECQN